MSREQTILGIDPGLADVGWGVIKLTNTKTTTLNYGSIKTTSGTAMTDRLNTIHTDLQEIIERYNPNYAAIEELFFGKNAKTAMKVGQARGVVLLTFAKYDIPISEFTPAAIKIALTGYGAANKQQVQKMVQQTLRLDKIPKPDHAADALGVAITAAVTNRNLQK